ncbi:hypothetical protein KUTeg_002666 [Tegillarca granosa]|uniref:Tesmin/TSO1-like CXC domain-containing protein n=1 Tax=Tegillarca granosa TaxID=220873 RepID=A0ABQ9FUY7_TEGGR|nr:hypothetical protein KUTeg_002666 [Tegillarca granosa]
MGSIGFYMKDSGFEDITVESGVCKRGTVNKIISGKDYYLMLRCHSIMSEAMIGLLWKAFEDWVDSDELDGIGLNSSLHDLAVALDNDDVIKVNSCLMEVNRKQGDISVLWEDFIETLSVTGKFWLMYVDMVLILKRYIHAERSGSWTQHLKEVENMLPYTISSQHAKYMVCLPLYLRDMKELPKKHPNVYENFIIRNFNVHRTNGKFNGIWTDLALEQTYNKEGKTTLFKGISQQPASRDKYIKTVPFLTKVSESVKAMVGIERQGHKHHGQSKSQDKKDQFCVEKIINVVNEQMINPFTCPNLEDLICISSGEKAENIDLISARSKGLEVMKLMEKGQSNVKPPKLTTFASKKKIKNAAESLVKIYQDESIVMRALGFFQGKDDNTREIAFSHEWTNYPTSLFDTDQRSESGFMMRKGTKSDFLAYLIKEVDQGEVEYDSLPDSDLSTVYLVDAMAFINRYYKLGGKTFGDFLQAFVGQLLRLKPSNCRCVNIVGDRYDFEDSVSLKGDERFRRGQSKTQREYFISESLEIVDWNAILHDVRNKANLLDFISNGLQTFANVGDVTFIVGGLSKDKKDNFTLYKSEKCEIPHLSCLDHEEADTRIVAHLAYCVENLDHTRAVIHATDTDIIILCMYHLTRLSTLRELWVQKFDKYIAMHNLVEKLCEKYECSARELSSSLLVAYVLSGCDTVSYPFRKGKKLAAKMALSMVKDFPNLSNFGVDNFTVSEELKVEARKYFASLYGCSDIDSLNVLRQHLFASSRTDLRVLPPTEDAFHQHFLRALYQIGMYTRATLSDLCLPSRTQFGRKLVNNKLVPILMCLPPKPMIKTPTGCKCQKSKCMRKCSCAKSSCPCSVICLCLGKAGKCGRISADTDSSASEDQ